MFVIDSDKLPNKGASMLRRFLISNWSKGLIINFVIPVFKPNSLFKYLVNVFHRSELMFL